jgi:hypothetical protein
LISFYIFCSASTAFGRFYHLDADEIDHEEKLSIEYYNDIYSYQSPISWDKIFQNSQLSYRGWAGSLNIVRSYLQEDIKLLTSKNPEPIELQFRQYREEGLLTQYLSQELRMQFNTPWGFYIAPLADAGTFKKWDDFGLALGFQQDSTRKIEFYLWSVDYYYNSKEENEGDHFNKMPFTYGGDIKWVLFKTNFTVSAFYDSPLRWERHSHSYIYENSRTLFDIGIQSPPWETYHLWTRIHYDIKKEVKEWSAVSAKKALSRSIAEYSIGLQRESNRHIAETSLTFFQRKANYENSNLKESVTESASNSLYRREWMLACTYNQPFFSNFFQWGLFYNHARKDTVDFEESNELKLQTAFELRISEHGYAFFNATWDIDQIVDSGIHPFRPWGGGSLNFMIAF